MHSCTRQNIPGCWCCGLGVHPILGKVNESGYLITNIRLHFPVEIWVIVVFALLQSLITTRGNPVQSFITLSLSFSPAVPHEWFSWKEVGLSALWLTAMGSLCLFEQTDTGVNNSDVHCYQDYPDRDKQTQINTEQHCLNSPFFLASQI